MKTILCATDYSDNSVAALKYAYQLARILEGRLLVIHVFDYPTVLGTSVHEPFPNLEKDAFEEHTLNLRNFCKTHLGKTPGGKGLEIQGIQHKNVRKAISAQALETGAYMLFVGMKGGSALREVLMGNTTRKLIAEAPCPVWSVPADASFNGVGKMVYATDYEVEDVAVLRLLVGLAEPLSSTIQLVHIASEEEYAGVQRKEWFLAKLKEEFDYQRLAFEEIFSNDIFETLRVYLGDCDADLAVMLEREYKSFLDNVFHTDMVRKMERYGRVPLMAFHEKNFKKQLSGKN